MILNYDFQNKDSVSLSHNHNQFLNNYPASQYTCSLQPLGVNQLFQRGDGYQEPLEEWITRLQEYREVGGRSLESLGD